MDSRLLEKYILGNTNEEESKQALEWIEQSEANKQEYLAQRKLYLISLCRSDVLLEGKTRSGFRLSIAREFLKIAAVLFIGILGTYLYLNYCNDEKGKETMQCFYTPPGQRAELSLEDGTHIWLNANSKIVYPTRFNKECRNVRLTGEAFFKVKHDANRPFVVTANCYQIQVKGTEFNVFAYGKKDCEVDLVRGSVCVTTPNKLTANLCPGERLYNKNGRIVKGKILDSDYFRWRDGMISFDGVTIETMVEKLKLYYGVNIRIADNRVKRYRYTGKFWTSDGIEQVLKVLQLDRKLNYKKESDENSYIIY